MSGNTANKFKELSSSTGEFQKVDKFNTSARAAKTLFSGSDDLYFVVQKVTPDTKTIIIDGTAAHRKTIRKEIKALLEK